MRALSLAALLLAGCAGVPVAPPPAPSASSPPTAAVPGTVQRTKSRWVPAAWADLQGWGDDALLDFWPAFLTGCARAPAAWRDLCAQALLQPPADETALRAWLEARLQPWRLESFDGGAEGLATGYFEPEVEATRRPQGAWHVPLHGPPDASVRGAYTRQQWETVPAAMAALRGREIAYVADPLDALVLQIQGSGRMHVTEPDGSRRTVRLAFAGHNEQPYRSVGRWLVERGEIAPEQASWPAIRAWARMNPQRVQEMLWANPRLVFFREEPLPDPTLGPRGAQGVPLTPGRSVAVDPGSVPYGTPLWISTTEPLGTAPLRRLVMAQDTGGAITGAVRIDFFWGAGEAAEMQAGRMKQPLRAWALWPRGAEPR